MVAVSSWGRLSAEQHKVIQLYDRDKVQNIIASTHLLGLAQGMGRSYGDVGLNPDGVLWSTTSLDRYISFDPSTGCLVCEPGILLGDIQRLAIQFGWILPVTPGTQMVTVGGAIANDVHGKNHHRLGSFGNHVQGIELVRTNGQKIECGPRLQPDWFAATVGGLGLTGMITKVQIQLRPIAGPYLNTQTIPFSNLEEFFQIENEAAQDWEYSVSWVDCLSKYVRGFFTKANHADGDWCTYRRNRKFIIPFVPPFSLVNRFSLQAFNSAYNFFKKLQSRDSIEHFEPFFYPLDGLLEWNRMYGPKGFFQYQSVVPRTHGLYAVNAMLKEITRAGEGSFLATLKTFGSHKSIGMLSFPRPGVTFALDFPNRGSQTLRLLENLDAIVREVGGRIYLAKDARQSRDLFELGYPRLSEFLKYRDPGISSAMSRRLMGS